MGRTGEAGRCERLAATGVRAERLEAQAGSWWGVSLNGPAAPQGPFWLLQEAATKQKVLWGQLRGKLVLPGGALL